MPDTNNAALQKAIEKAGSISALARLCGVSRAAVHDWINNGLPNIERVIQVEEVTGVKRQELKPEWFTQHK